MCYKKKCFSSSCPYLHQRIHLLQLQTKLSMTLVPWGYLLLGSCCSVVCCWRLIEQLASHSPHQTEMAHHLVFEVVGQLWKSLPCNHRTSSPGRGAQNWRTENTVIITMSLSTTSHEVWKLRTMNVTQWKHPDIFHIISFIDSIALLFRPPIRQLFISRANAFTQFKEIDGITTRQERQ